MDLAHKLDRAGNNRWGNLSYREVLETFKLCLNLPKDEIASGGGCYTRRMEFARKKTKKRSNYSDIAQAFNNLVSAILFASADFAETLLELE